MRCDLIGPRVIDYYVNNPYAYLIDVRPNDMYNISHIENAFNWPFSQLNTFEGYRRFLNYFKDKNKIYVIYCDKGANSMIAGNNLAAYGYRTKSLVGGFQSYKGKYIVNSACD